MRIKRPAGLSGFELALVTALGIIGGIYIWKPIFTQQKDSKRPEEPPESSS